MSQHLVVLLLGSNLGNQRENIGEALGFIESEIGIINSKSEFLSTNPVEFESCNIFCNIAVRISTSFSPIKLLERLKAFEVNSGRKEDSAVTGEYSDRIIDLDIVNYDGITFKSKKLILPHSKHLFERDFSEKLISELGN